MTREEILENLRVLGNSQGFYSRMYERLSDGSIESERALSDLKQNGFKDIIDLIFYFES